MAYYPDVSKLAGGIAAPKILVKVQIQERFPFVQVAGAKSIPVGIEMMILQRLKQRGRSSLHDSREDLRFHSHDTYV